MKKLLTSAISLLIVLLLVAPTCLSVVSFAADTSEEANVWDKLKPAYMKANFSDISARIKGTEEIAGMECRLVTGGYAIYVDPLTAEVVCLKLKAPDADGNYSVTDGVYDYDGYYSTNPFAVGRSESVDSKSPTSDSVKQTLYSQLLVKYTENSNEVELSSFKDAALNNQITVKDIRNGIRVEYTLGREEVTYLVPRRIRYDKYLNILYQIAQNSAKKKDKRSFAAFYSLYAINADQLDYELDRDSMTADVLDFFYTTREEGKTLHPGKGSEFGVQWGLIPAYYERINSESNKTISERIRDYPFVQQFAFMVCDSTIQASDLKRLEQMVKLNTDYSNEQMTIDHAETEYSASDKIPALFKMAIEYTINEYGLQIRLNAGNVRFDSSNYKLSNISFLPYAGAADTNNEGFILSPDGSGTIIRLEDIKGQQFTTTSSMYGQDYAYHTVSGANKEVMRYPGFGVVETITKKEEYEDTEIYVDENGEEQTETVIKTRDIKSSHGYFGLITEGATLSKLTVVNGGSLHMFASVYTSFNPRPKDSYVLNGGISVGNDSMWTVESKRKYTGDYKLQIFILDNDHSNHIGMATVYRNYLADEGVITKLDQSGSDDIPLYLQTLGALETSKTFLGVPYDTVVPLTSFVRVKEILEMFKNNEINNVKIILQGITNGGLISYVPTDFTIEKCLEEGHDDVKGMTFKELIEYANANNYQLFPDFDFSLALRDELFDGFNAKDDLSKTINDENAIMREYDPVWQAFIKNGCGIISANAMNKLYDGVYAGYKDYNVGGISVQSLGNMLSSDFNEDDPLNREDSRKLIVKLLAKIKEQNGNVLISGGNAYALPYATDIINMPIDDSRYKYSKASVPFLGIVLHSYKEYAGEPINLAGNYSYTLLKTIESGASPYYTVAYDNTAELKEYATYSTLAKYYSIKYTILVKDLIETYRTLNDALSSVKYATIVGHEFLDDDYKVVKVTYDNGDVFYLNYLLKDYTLTVDGKKFTVPAQDFLKNPA